MMKWRDIIFGKYQWYRKWCGGIWYNVAPWPHLPYISPFWTQYPIKSERIFYAEVYNET